MSGGPKWCELFLILYCTPYSTKLKAIILKQKLNRLYSENMCWYSPGISNTNSEIGIRSIALFILQMKSWMRNGLCLMALQTHCGLKV